MKLKKLILTFILIYLSGLVSGIFIELKIYKQFQEIITVLSLSSICICGFFYWKSQAVKWITNIWLFVYIVSIIIFVICSIGYYFLGWASPYSKHILPTLSPVTFVVLFLLNRLANMKPQIETQNKQ